MKQRFGTRYGIELERTVDGVYWRLVDPLDDGSLIASGDFGGYVGQRRAIIRELVNAIENDLNLVMPEAEYDDEDEIGGDGWEALDT
jgi:hypothetical protein